MAGEGAPGAWRRPLMSAAALAGGVALATVWAGGAGAVPGALTPVQALIDGTGGVDGIDGAFGVTVSPDGAHVYAAGFTDDAVAAFSRDAATGTLAFVEMEQDGVGGVDGLDGVARMALAPDGTNLYAASETDQAVAVFSRSAATGELTFVEVEKDGVAGVDGLAGAFGVAVSPDGTHVYTVGQTDNAVSVFARDPATGALSFVEMKQDGVGGVQGLAVAAGVTVSPDGAAVYVAGYDDSAVAIFARDPTTGRLSFVDVAQDGVEGVDGLDGAIGVAVSIDGKHLYATGTQDDAVAAFTRNAVTGELTFVEAEKDGVNGVNGLDGAQVVVPSPVGGHVYVGSGNGDAVTVFARDPATGALEFLEGHRDGVAGVESLDNVGGVSVAGDGRSLYTAAFADSAVTVFSIEPTPCRGQPVTIVGGPSDDVLTGTSGRDVIAGVGGKDRINAGGGKDLICGGTGNDTLKGGAGKDRLLGQGGRDLLAGGAGGGDVCTGGPGKDTAKRSCEKGRA